MAYDNHFMDYFHKGLSMTHPLHILEHHEHATMCNDSLEQLNLTSQTLMQLDALQMSLQQHGCSESLISFADHDHTLTTHIPAFVQAHYDTDQYDLATEGLLTTIGQTLRRWSDHFMEFIVKQKKHLKSINVFLSLCYVVVNEQNMRNAINDYNFLSKIGLGNAHLKKTAIKHAPAIIGFPVVYGMLHLAKSVPLAIREALELRLPDDVNSRSDYVHKIKNIFNDRAGIDIYNLKLPTIQSQDKGKSAVELGYTKQNVQTCVSETIESINEIKRCTFIPDKLEQLSRSVEASTSNGRAALVFLTSLINKTLNLAVHDVLKADLTIKHIFENEQ